MTFSAHKLVHSEPFLDYPYDPEIRMTESKWL